MNTRGVSESILYTKEELLFLGMKRKYPDLIDYGLNDRVVGSSAYSDSVHVSRVCGMRYEHFTYYVVMTPEREEYPGQKHEANVFNVSRVRRKSDADLARNMCLKCCLHSYDRVESGCRPGNVIIRKSDGRRFRIKGMRKCGRDMVLEDCTTGKRETHPSKHIVDGFDTTGYYSSILENEVIKNADIMDPYAESFNRAKADKDIGYLNLEFGDYVLYSDIPRDHYMRIVGADIKRTENAIVSVFDRKSGHMVGIEKLFVGNFIKAESEDENGYPTASERQMGYFRMVRELGNYPDDSGAYVGYEDLGSFYVNGNVVWYLSGAEEKRGTYRLIMRSVPGGTERKVKVSDIKKYIPIHKVDDWKSLVK